MRTPSTLLLALAALAVTPPAFASTVCDFDGACSPNVTGQHALPPGPAVVSGGPRGAFLRLVSGLALPSRNTLSFDLTDSGAYGVVTADFDFRLTPAAGRADGFGFAILNTADYGATGTVAGGYEEPRFAGSIGIGFDIHQGPTERTDTHVSVHFNGAMQLETGLLPGLDLAPPGGQWIHARIVMRPGAGLSDVTVILTPARGAPRTVIDRFKVAGFIPYEGRVHFGGRTGGESADHDLDNVQVVFSGRLTDTFSFSDSTFAAVENGGSAYVTVVRKGSALSPASVEVAASVRSAMPGSDYEATTETLTFAPGEAVKGLHIPILDDAIRESTESLLVSLRGPSSGWRLGSPAAAVVSIFDDELPDRVGAWSDPIDWPEVAVHMHLLPTGKVMFWPAHDMHGDSGDHPHAWDPATGMIEPLMMAGHDIFCSGHAFSAKGELLVAGGDVAAGTGLPHAALYNPFSDEWSLLDDMNEGRWYPTSTTLANGDVLVTAGTVEPGIMNCVPQVWQNGGFSWRDLTDASLCEPYLAQYYPFNHLLPSGRVFSAGPQMFSQILDTSGGGRWTPVARSLDGYRDYGSAAMYAPSKVMIVGGNRPDPSALPRILPGRTSEVIDLRSSVPTWRRAASMRFRRRQHTATILPDGKVLVTGGSASAGFNDAEGAVLAAEMWDPSANAWTTLSAMQVPRLYHSTALLLPDGRVVVAGGGQPAASSGGQDQRNAETFSPPYLFRGPRPRIDAAPAELAYGETFLVATPDATRISKVTLLRLGSVTHGFDQNQKFTSLPFTRTATGLRVAGPASSQRTPPGHWMLFLVDTRGIPSIAPIVTVAPGPLAVTAPADSDLFDCRPGAAPPTIQWDPASHDRFYVQVAWDWEFPKSRRVSSGDAVITGGAWQAPASSWRAACAGAKPLLYVRVRGTDLNLPETDIARTAWSDVVVVPIQK